MGNSSREEIEALIDRELAQRKLEAYQPYARQAEFHAAGADHRERLFCAGNQLGKTLAGAAEMAAHLTGRYPDGWRGRRFTRAIAAWASGVTGESVRDTTQRLSGDSRCPGGDSARPRSGCSLAGQASTGPA